MCFDAVGLVVWPVKIVPDMTYNVFGGMLNLAQSILSFQALKSPELGSQKSREIFECGLLEK